MAIINCAFSQKKRNANPTKSKPKKKIIIESDDEDDYDENDDIGDQNGKTSPLVNERKLRTTKINYREMFEDDLDDEDENITIDDSSVSSDDLLDSSND